MSILAFPNLVKCKMIKRYSIRSLIFTGILFFFLGYSICAFFQKNCDDTKESNLDVDVVVNKVVLDLLENVEYAVVVLTGPENEENRDAIRRTWSRLASNIVIENGEKLYRWDQSQLRQDADFIKLFFVIGTSRLKKTKLRNLADENRRNGDLLLLKGFGDSYNNLSMKMLHTLKWLNKNVRKLKYLIKCDDDSFVRIDLIVRELLSYAPSMNSENIKEYVSYQMDLLSYNGLYWGYFIGKARVFGSGKWKEPNWFLCDRYLPYAVGGAYVISHSIVDYIGKNHDILSPYKSEDVSMGVWTAPLKGINRVHDIRFDTEWRSRGCLNSMLVRHKQTPQDMFQMYNSLVRTQGQKLCDNEVNQWPHHMYRWDGQPSMCCKK